MVFKMFRYFSKVMQNSNPGCLAPDPLSSFKNRVDVKTKLVNTGTVDSIEFVWSKSSSYN